jgi:hypothetical protein
VSQFRNEPFNLAAISERRRGLGHGIFGVLPRHHAHQAGDLIVLPLRIMDSRWTIFLTGMYLAVINRYRHGSWRVGRGRGRQLVFFPQARQMVTLTGQFVSYPLGKSLYMSTGDLEFQHFCKCLFGVLEGSVVAAEVGDLPQEYRRVVLRPELK